MCVRLVEQLFKQSWKIYFLLVPTVTASVKPCSNFEFPAIESNGSALTISENESLTLRFSVNPYDIDCPHKGSFILYVAKAVSHTKTECVLFHQNFTCQDPAGKAFEDQSTVGLSTVLNNGGIKNVQTSPVPGDDPSFEFVTSVLTATAAAVVAVVIVVVAIPRTALSARLARSEECVMLPNFLYDCSRSLPDMCEGPYAEVHDHTGPKRIDINNRPPAPLPPDARDEEADKVSSEYAVVDGDAEGTDEEETVVSTSDYVPIRDILERKRETQFEDAS
ncbi:hypothetical protein BaRGS_00033037, partial [Batillaria attramentaria]